MLKISPSVLNADYLTLANEIKILEAAGVDMLHLDVMDGIFVPNISFGVPVIQSIKKHTRLPLDVHLMIDRPHRYIEQFAKVADILGFHYEAGSNVANTLHEIRALGVKNCLTIKPQTPAEAIFEYLPLCDMVLIMSVEPGFGGQSFMPSSLKKAAALRQQAGKLGLNFDIEIDGGINRETAALAVQHGVNVLVAGSYLVGAPNAAERVQQLKALENA